MENRDVSPLATQMHPMDTSETNWLERFFDELEPDLFETENFLHENRVNGTTKTVFDRRSEIDRTNRVFSFVGQYGFKWDGVGECTICGIECYWRCEKCPWIFYCSENHQIDDWTYHTCSNVLWYEDGHARATKDLLVGTVIMERTTVFVAPRFHTDLELHGMTDEDREQITDGPMRPCFGCHELIQPFLNSNLVCETCNFPMHSKACAASEWHKDECQIYRELLIDRWYDQLGRRKNIMIHFAVLRGILLKHSKPSLWSQIIALDPNATYMTSEELKNQRFTLSLHCCMAMRPHKKMVSVMCSGMIPFTLVRDENANVQGGVYNYRMRMTFHTVKPIVRGEILNIGRGGYLPLLSS